MRVIKLKTRKIKKHPVTIVLPKEFIRANRIVAGDVIVLYLTESKELIIKKLQEVL